MSDTNDSATNDVVRSLERKTITDDDPWLGGSTPRLSSAQRRKIIAYCLRRDGARCMIPGCRKPGQFDPEYDCTIHHGQRGPADHHASNLCLAHDRCNKKFRETRPSSMTEHVRERTTLTSVMTSLELKRPLSAEIAKNEDYEPLFRRKCFEKMLEVSHKKGLDSIYTQKQLRIFARVYVGCSGQASYSYIESLFGEGGPFTEEIDLTTQDHYVTFRKRADANLTVSQLEAKYPKTGTRNSRDI